MYCYYYLLSLSQNSPSAAAVAPLISADGNFARESLALKKILKLGNGSRIRRIANCIIVRTESEGPSVALQTSQLSLSYISFIGKWKQDLKLVVRSTKVGSLKRA